MTAPFTVRDVAPADFDRWLPLWDGCNAFYKRTGSPPPCRWRG